MENVSTKRSDTYFIATYADGPYWKSALEVLLYPTGCSFGRSYSFRKEYLGADIYDMEKLPEGRGFLGIRLGQRERPEQVRPFIPTRRIETALLREQPGIQLHLRLGEFIDYSKAESLSVFDLSKGIPNEDRQVRRLLCGFVGHELAAELQALETCTEFPDRLCDLLVADSKLNDTARKNFEGTSLLVHHGVLKHTDLSQVQIGEIDKHGGVEETCYGYALRAGDIYHFRFSLITLVSREYPEKLGNVAFRCTAPESRVQLSRAVISQTGNYRSERLWMLPTKVEPARTQLEWIPEAADGGPQPKAAGPCIHYTAEAKSWFKFQTGRFIVGFCFTVVTVVAFWQAFSLAATQQKELSAVAIALGAVLAPLGVGLLARWIDDYLSYRR